MSEKPPEEKSRNPSAQDRRMERQAKALRANLKRRKEARPEGRGGREGRKPVDREPPAG